MEVDGVLVMRVVDLASSKNPLSEASSLPEPISEMRKRFMIPETNDRQKERMKEWMNAGMRLIACMHSKQKVKRIDFGGAREQGADIFAQNNTARNLQVPPLRVARVLDSMESSLHWDFMTLASGAPLATESIALATFTTSSTTHSKLARNYNGDGNSDGRQPLIFYVSPVPVHAFFLFSSWPSSMVTLSRWKAPCPYFNNAATSLCSLSVSLSTNCT